MKYIVYALQLGFIYIQPSKVEYETHSILNKWKYYLVFQKSNFELLTFKYYSITRNIICITINSLKIGLNILY